MSVFCLVMRHRTERAIGGGIEAGCACLVGRRYVEKSAEESA